VGEGVSDFARDQLGLGLVEIVIQINFLLILLAPPYIEPRSHNVVINEGETVTLKCNVTANPAAKIKWYRDGKMISGKRDSAFHYHRYSVTHRYVTPLGMYYLMFLKSASHFFVYCN